MGICTAPMTAWAQSLRMRLVPPGAHGRLFALLRTAMQATPPAGAALAVLTLTHGTLAAVTAVAAVMGLPALILARNLMTAATDAEHDSNQEPAASTSPKPPRRNSPATAEPPSGT
jgi:MFS-type transporter involved in bile tolerance (Atg22 family)